MKFRHVLMLSCAKEMNLVTINEAYNAAAIAALPGHTAALEVEGRILVIRFAQEDLFKMDKDGRLASTVSWETVEMERRRWAPYRLLISVLSTLGYV